MPDVIELIYNVGFWILFFVLAVSIRFVAVRLHVFRNPIIADLVSVLYIYAVLGYLLFEYMGAWGWYVVTGPLLGSAISAFCFLVAYDMIRILQAEHEASS